MIKSILIKLLTIMGLIVLCNRSEMQADDSHGSIFPDGSVSLSKSHFTWGVDLGSSIDMTANNLSTFDAEANLGFKNDFFKIAGIGAGVHKAFGSGNMFVPVYGVIRTSFRSEPSPVFFNFQAGYSFNTFSDSSSDGGFNMSVGIGMNLAISKLFKSHIILSYGYFHINRNHLSDISISNSNVSLARLAIGVNF